MLVLLKILFRSNIYYVLDSYMPKKMNILNLILKKKILNYYIF